MDLLKEYDFDCLPLIDREFDNPAVQGVVHSMIAAEMRSFAPADYLGYLPYPELSFANSTALQAEMVRLETAPSSSSAKLNMDRYMADRPSTKQEKDEQAWRDAIANVKAQLGHQDNRLMNAEVGEIGLGGLWLQQNTIVEQITKRYAAETDAMSRTIRETNKARQAMQVKAYPELKKLHHNRETSLQRKFMCQQAYNRVKGIMLEQGVNAEQIIADRHLRAAIEIDANSAAYNSTVREYETINESSTADGSDAHGTAEEGQANGPASATKRQRRA